MTTLVRRYLKTAIVFLMLGLLLGGWMMVRRELWNSYPSTFTVSAHTHAILVGFVMMMILGVSLWMFPRPAKGDSRYKHQYANVAYWLVTAGTAGRIGGELLRTPGSSLPLRLVLVVLGFTQLVGLLVFFYGMWPRIRAVGSAVREANGERF